MKNFLRKLRLIYFPVLKVAVFFILVYSVLNGLLVIKFELIPIREDFAFIWIPLVVAFFALLIWVTPKARCISESKHFRTAYLFECIAFITLALPTVLMQYYLRDVGQSMTVINSVNQINTLNPGKYYQLESYYLDVNRVKYEYDFTISGKNNEDLNAALYFVMPVYESARDTQNVTSEFWIAKEYSISLSNRLEDSVKEKELSKFEENSFVDFYVDVPFTYLEKCGYTAERKFFLKAVKGSSVAVENPIVLLAHDESFDPGNVDFISWTIVSFLGAAILLLVVTSIVKLKEVIGPVEDANPWYHEIKEMFGFLIPAKDFFTTPIFVSINLIVFLSMVFSGLGFNSFSLEDLVAWGANSSELVHEGEWWRLLSTMFIHSGFMHLMSDMLCLAMFGGMLEKETGKWNIAIIYLVSGIAGNLVPIYLYNDILVGSLSGISGLCGVTLVFVLTRTFATKFDKNLMIGLAGFFIGSYLLLSVTGFVSEAYHVGNLTGFIIGLTAGFVISPSVKRAQALNQEEHDYGDENA